MNTEQLLFKSLCPYFYLWFFVLRYLCMLSSLFPILVDIVIPVPRVEEEEVLDIDFSSASVFESILSGRDINIQVRKS